MRLKKIIPIVALVLVALVAGVASVRFGRQQQVRPPHTIIAKQTAFDETGKAWNSTIIRHVKADGMAEETQILWDGQVKHTTLHLKGSLTPRSSTPDMPEHLGRKYFEENNASMDTWISPDLQDYLRAVVKREDGTVQTIYEAIEVSEP
jgi:hypothetical protein